MIRKTLGIFTSIVAAMAVVGVAWATGDLMSSAEASSGSTPVTNITLDDSTVTTGGTTGETTGATPPDVSTPPTDNPTSSSSTSTSIASTTSTSAGNTTSTSDDRTSTTSTTVRSSTSTSFDDSENRTAPGGVTTYQLAGVGSFTIEVFQGRLHLSSVSAPGWTIEEQRVEPDRIEIELTTGEAEAEFEARIKNGRVEVETEIDLD